MFVCREMDRYQRVEKPKAETPINENEIRITTQGRMRNYITYATTLLQVCPLFISVLSLLLINMNIIHDGLLLLFLNVSRGFTLPIELISYEFA